MEVTGPSEHRLHVKYHIIAMTAVAYAQGLRETGRSACVCVKLLWNRAVGVIFPHVCVSKFRVLKVGSCAHPECSVCLWARACSWCECYPFCAPELELACQSQKSGEERETTGVWRWERKGESVKEMDAWAKGKGRGEKQQMKNFSFSSFPQRVHVFAAVVHLCSMFAVCFCSSVFGCAVKCCLMD